MKEIMLKKGHHLGFVLLIGLFSFLFVNIAKADPPTRVARISYLNGSVSFSPAGQTQWMYATYNRPLTTNDRLWADANSRAELQLGAATVRINNNSALTIVNLDDTNAQFLLSQGTLNVRVWIIRSGQSYEVDTPNLSLIIRKTGDYRIDVKQNITSVSVRSGKGEIYGQGASYLIQAPQSCQFIGANISNYQCYGLPVPDSFDQWCNARNTQAQNTTSSRYVSREVIGYQDLDNYGTWSYMPGYGNVWTPTSVPSGWAPYRYGQWVWIAPWGWTWVDNSPWGFAPYHYGRWAFIRGNWYWVPGAFDRRPIYAPALVVFVGNFQVSIGGGNNNIGWFPLGPGEIYVPSYRVSKDYFTYVNVNNTTINNTYITQMYNKPPKNVVYKNKTVADAVSVVPLQDFTKSKAVKDILLKVQSENIQKAQIVPAVTMPPATDNKASTAVPANIQPPEQAFNKPMLKFKSGKGQSFPAPTALEPKPIAPSSKPQQPLGPPASQEPMQPVKPTIIQPPTGLMPTDEPAKVHSPKHKKLSPTTTPESLTPSSGAPIPPPGAFGPSSTKQPSELTPPALPEKNHPKHKALHSTSPESFGPSVAPTPPASVSQLPASSSLAPATPSELSPSLPSQQKHPHKHKELPQSPPAQSSVTPPTFTPQPPETVAPLQPSSASAPAAPIPAPVAPPPAAAQPEPAATAPPPRQMHFQGPKEHMQLFAPPAPSAAAQASPADDKNDKDKNDNGQSTGSN